MQAAGGEALTPGQAPQESGRSTVRLFAAIVAISVLLDQVTKILAVRYLQDREPIEVIPGLIDLRFLLNPGAALGTGSSYTILLTLIAIVVSIAVLRMATKLRDRGWAVGLGLLLGGAIGNLIDRLVRDPSVFRGHVVDFIDYGPFVGNVADIALTFAAGVILWQSWRGIGLDGTRESDD